MFEIYGAIRVLSIEKIVTVHNSILNEMVEILYGLNVNYILEEVKINENLTNIILN